jgi:hypothetical protein
VPFAIYKPPNGGGWQLDYDPEAAAKSMCSLKGHRIMRAVLAFVHMLITEFWNLLFAGYIVGVTSYVICCVMHKSVRHGVGHNRFLVFWHVVADHSFAVHAWLDIREFFMNLGSHCALHIHEKQLPLQQTDTSASEGAPLVHRNTQKFHA